MSGRERVVIERGRSDGHVGGGSAGARFRQCDALVRRGRRPECVSLGDGRTGRDAVKPSTVVRPALLVAAAATLITGCDRDSPDAASPSSADSPSTSATRTTLTAPGLQPPRQRNQNRPDVVYDPCTYLDDETVRAAGADPGTRRRNDLAGEYTFLDCIYEGKDWTMTVSSSNITMAEQRQRYAGLIEETDVFGRPSIIVREPQDPDMCALTMPTNEGDLRIHLYLRTDALVRGMKPCDDTVRIAKVIEPTVGEGK